MRVSQTADFIDENMQYLIMFMIILAVLVFFMIVYIVCRMTKTRKVRIQKLRSSQKLDPQFVIDDSKAEIITKNKKRKKLNMQDDVFSSSNARSSSSNGFSNAPNSKTSDKNSSGLEKSPLPRVKDGQERPTT